MHNSWTKAFAKVVVCSRCTKEKTDPNLLCDDNNLPQPGYIGPRYATKRVLFVGQNPGYPKKSRAELDLRQSSALEQFRKEPTIKRYNELISVVQCLLWQTPLRQKYFPLEECGLQLEELAYCNLIRCRTSNDRQPRCQLAKNCIDEHFTHWLRLLQPTVVIFIGKWAYDHGNDAVLNQGIRYHDFINRQRSLPAQQRKENMNRIVRLVHTAGVNECQSFTAL